MIQTGDGASAATASIASGPSTRATPWAAASGSALWTPASASSSSGPSSVPNVHTAIPGDSPIFSARVGNGFSSIAFHFSASPAPRASRNGPWSACPTRSPPLTVSARIEPRAIVSPSGRRKMIPSASSRALTFPDRPA